MKIRSHAILILALASASAVIGMTLITPSLPMIRFDFKISADTTQLILTFYLIFISIGQIFFGTLSDRYGRRPILIYGSILYCIGGLLAMYSPNIQFLIFARIVQASGAAACMSMARLIVNDSFEKNEAAEKLSLITAIMVIFPNIALILGGAIVETIGWRGVMCTIFVFGFFLFIGSYFLIPESNKSKKQSLDFKNILISYKKIMQNSLFLNFSSIAAIQSGIFFSMFSFMPYEFYRIGVSPLQFGFWLSFTGIGYFFGNIINQRFASKVGISKMCMIGCIGSIIAFILLLLFDLNGFKSPLFISLPMLFFGLSNGITVANALIGAISSTPDNPGVANGLAGAMQMASGGIFGSFIISFGGDKSFMIAIMIILFIGIFAVYNSFVTYKLSVK